MTRSFLQLLAAFLVIVSCKSEADQVVVENGVKPLPSWNAAGSAKEIVDYVDKVTKPGSQSFIPVEDRIAVFDNDGTLWSEQPIYFQLFFAIDRLRFMSADHPEWKETQPYKAVLEGKLDTLSSFGLTELLQIVMTSHSEMSTAEFQAVVQQWTDTATHPLTGAKYSEMVFQPMLELLDYLREKDFKTYIVSGGGVEFMRPWAEEVYGIPPEQVIGSTIKSQFQLVNGEPVLMRLPELDFVNDKEGKPISINKYIGRKPVICAGNSDGDLQMMQWTASNDYESLMIYIHHTDAEREWAYDRDSHIGRFDKAFDEAKQKSWLIVDMAKDWEYVYPD